MYYSGSLSCVGFLLRLLALEVRGVSDPATTEHPEVKTGSELCCAYSRIGDRHSLREIAGVVASSFRSGKRWPATEVRDYV